MTVNVLSRVNPDRAASTGQDTMLMILHIYRMTTDVAVLNNIILTRHIFANIVAHFFPHCLFDTNIFCHL